MTREAFFDDIQAIYTELQDRQAELDGFYALTKGEAHDKASQVVDAFLTLLDIPRTDETVMAALTRIVSLREDALEQTLRKLGFDDEAIRIKKELAYGFVSMFHITRHESLIGWIEEHKLLTPFYRALLFGVHFVGLRLSEWQSHWTHRIIHGVNRELSELFNGDDAKVFAMLHQEGLLDGNEAGEVADRCYSILVKEGQKYRSAAYAEAFEQEAGATVTALEQLIALLRQHDDEVLGQKEAWIVYFEALKEAFAHRNVDELVGKWAEVDRRWMAITAPIQVGHPLEYYEDHYRKAVALEWDVRIVNPRLQDASHVKDNIKLFAFETAQKLGEEAVRIVSKNLLQVDRTQLYIGRPMLFYAAEFNGLFSAQVVPNDEGVSAELGKKIFAYADFVRESKLAKPVLKLSVEMFGEAFVKKQRDVAAADPDTWYAIYDISTIGHEYGHTLWIDRDTETAMNVSGQFKNIEEFKATTGGMMAFFRKERDGLKEAFVDDLVSRAVGLMAWREAGEVLPYYCEGLMHLHLLFASGVIAYDRQIRIDYTRYDAMKQLYAQTYEALAKHYVAKRDAAKFLQCYVSKVDGVYLPKETHIRDFVEHYYERYKAIGRETVGW